MLMRTSITALLILSCLGSEMLQAASSGLVQRDHLQAELVAEVDSVLPGTELRVGLRMVPDAGWHTYWKNPGDSGLATTIEWTLPEGVSASAIAWPYPDAIPFAHLINYGYDGEHLLPVTLSIPADLATDQSLRLEASADWLVCEEICIPGDATLELELPVSNQAPVADRNVAELFAWADARRPEAVDWPARFSTEGGQLSVQVESEAIGSARGWEFFSEDNNLVDHSVEPVLNAGKGQLFVAQALSPFVNRFPDALDFVLVERPNNQAYRLNAEAGALISTGAVASSGASSGASSAPQIGWLSALGLALLGGLLLNLMPCVFPVLSIKAISLVEGAGSDQRAHGLAYTAGVVLSFAALAAVLLGLRSAGEAIGWGFQLQSPWIVGLLIYVLFALGLSLSGLFDLGGGLMNTGQNLTEKSGLKGSFFTGVLACIVASPCTAPFMGAALGAAVLMAWPMAMSIFVALGLGLALPLLLLSFSPALARWLPRPGPVDGHLQAGHGLPPVSGRGLAGLGAGPPDRREWSCRGPDRPGCAGLHPVAGWQARWRSGPVGRAPHLGFRRSGGRHRRAGRGCPVQRGAGTGRRCLVGGLFCDPPGRAPRRPRQGRVRQHDRRLVPDLQGQRGGGPEQGSGA